uniref:Candidate secreted effector n=2 Tax=Meloidogyne TaxID=189290 RepID=A0A914LA30_MELIC
MSAWLYLVAAIIMFVSGFYANTYLRENYGIEFTSEGMAKSESSSKPKGKRGGGSSRSKASKGASSKGRRDKKKGADSKAGAGPEAGTESKRGKRGARSHGKKGSRSSAGRRSASQGPAARKPMV